MKAFRHRVDCHSSEDKFLGGAEFKTARRWPSERTLRHELLQRLKAVLKPAADHRHTFTLNQKWGEDLGPQGRKRERAPAVVGRKPSGRMPAPALEAQQS